MRSTLRNAVVLIVVIACGCKEDDDDEPMAYFDSGALPNFDAGADAGRADSGGPGIGLLDSSVRMDASAPLVDTGAPLPQDATVPADAATDAANMDAGGGDAGDGGASDAGADASDGGGDASVGDAGGDARVDGGGDGGPRDGGRDGAADASGDARVDAGPPVTFTRVYQIISANCSPCHVGETRGNLDMGSKDTAYLELVTRNNGAAEGAQCDDMGRRRVIPLNPDDSLLVQKLRDPPCGSRMPLGRDELDAALLGEIEAWISAGAANN